MPEFYYERSSLNAPTIYDAYPDSTHGRIGHVQRVLGAVSPLTRWKAWYWRDHRLQAFGATRDEAVANLAKSVEMWESAQKAREQ